MISCILVITINDFDEICKTEKFYVQSGDIQQYHRDYFLDRGNNLDVVYWDIIDYFTTNGLPYTQKDGVENEGKITETFVTITRAGVEKGSSQQQWLQ